MVTMHEFAAALIEEFVTAVEAVVGTATATATRERAGADGWRVTATAAGDLRGSVEAWIDRAGSEVLAQRVMGMDDAPDDATVADMLREMWAQAAGALSLRSPFTGVKLSLGGAERADAPANAVVCDLRAGDATARIAVGGNVVASAAAVPPPAVTPELVNPETNGKLDIVLDMELPLTVRFARTVMTMKALTGLGPGSIVDMERSPDEPVQMLVGDRVIARGEVVVVGGNYGVRVTDLVSPAERARALEG